jgi:hypothetical protein
LARVRGGDLAYRDLVPPYKDSILSSLHGGAEYRLAEVRLGQYALLAPETITHPDLLFTETITLSLM